MEHETGTKERLLHAAIDVINEQGVKGIRIREIAAAAGVREPSVYHFFGSREGLVEAALVERFNVHLSELYRVFGTKLKDCRTQEDFVALVRRMFQQSFSEERNQIRSMRADIIGSAQSRPKLKEAITQKMLESYTELNNFIEGAQIRGWVDPKLDGLTFAAWMMSIVNGRVYIEMNPEPYNAQTWEKLSVDAVLLAMGYVNDKPIWEQ